MPNILSAGDWHKGMVIDRSNDPPSMDDKATPSPPERQVWQYEADKLLGHNSRPWPSDAERIAALVNAGLASYLPPSLRPRQRSRPMKKPSKPKPSKPRPRPTY